MDALYGMPYLSSSLTHSLSQAMKYNITCKGTVAHSFVVSFLSLNQLKSNMITASDGKEVWYGMVWYGVVWCGVVWHGMIWYGIIVW